MSEREKLKKLAEAATPGPWDYSRNAGCRTVGTRESKRIIQSILTTDGITPDKQDAANAKYIAAANPSTILALLSELEQAERERDTLTGLKDAMVAYAKRIQAAPRVTNQKSCATVSHEHGRVATKTR